MVLTGLRLPGQGGSGHVVVGRAVHLATASLTRAPRCSGVYIRRDAVAQVEHVSGAITEAVQRIALTCCGGWLTSGLHSRMAGSRLPWSATRCPTRRCACLGEGNRPVQAQGVGSPYRPALPGGRCNPWLKRMTGTASSFMFTLETRHDAGPGSAGRTRLKASW